MKLRLPLLVLSLYLAAICAKAGTSGIVASNENVPGIHNFIRATTNVFSGSQPDGEASFAALAKLGVKTIISVDGAKPHVELAARHGLRYIHLPIGYDGIQTARVAELAKAAAVSPGPVFVHCHHGMHRGPAAVSVICLANAGWSKVQAEQFMKQAGTGAEYQGLYRAASDFTAPTVQQLAAVPTNFPSLAKTSSLVDSMVAVDKIYENLKLAQAAGWQTPGNHPDISPKHEALMLVEQFREMRRMPDLAKRPADLQAKIEQALNAASVMHGQLNSTMSNRHDTAFKAVGQSCVECHKRYRNI